MEILIALIFNVIAIVVIYVLIAKSKKSNQIGNNEWENKATALQEEKIALANNVSRLEEHLRSKDEKIGELRAQEEKSAKERNERQNEILQLIKDNASKQEQIHSKDRRIEELEKTIEDIKVSEEKLEERLKIQFEVISNKIIDNSREKVNKFNAERLGEMLKPFEREIKDFKEQMSTANKEQSKERTELELKIKQMVEISEGMSTDAKNLTKALRGNNKTAGNWGETILENILQNSGLTQGKEGYELQSMLRDEYGNAYKNDEGKKMIPDAIVHFPDNRNVIIDSKVSITAYTDYCNTEDNDTKNIFLKQHIDSIKAHIKGLNVKSYETYVDGSLDFVMMFIPNDFAAMVALQEDLNLWQDAYNKKILIISPTNLITSLKIVSDLWSREKQLQNIEDILKRGQFLYDKCCSFTESFKKVGDGLNTLISNYDTASSQLGEKSGIIRQAEMLVESGIKSKKRLAMRSLEAKAIDEESEES